MLNAETIFFIEHRMHDKYWLSVRGSKILIDYCAVLKNLILRLARQWCCPQATTCSVFSLNCRAPVLGITRPCFVLSMQHTLEMSRINIYLFLSNFVLLSSLTPGSVVQIDQIFLYYFPGFLNLENWGLKERW